jgi:hypothetical protein
MLVINIIIVSIKNNEIIFVKVKLFILIFLKLIIKIANIINGKMLIPNSIE